MKKSNLGAIILLIFTLICATILISFKYYNQTTSTFSKQISVSEVRLVNNDNSSYLELKNSIKEKYLIKLNESISKISNEYENGVTKILGNDYKTYVTKLNSIKKELNDKKSKFLSSNEYLNKKKELVSIIEKMDKAEKEEYDSLYESFQKSLSELATLNVKLNNSLKALREEYDQTKLKLVNLFDNNKEQLKNFRNKQKKAVSNIILEIINEYNFELSELNSAFNLSQNKMREFPFEIEKLDLKSVSSPYESEYFCETTVESSESNVKIEFVDAEFDSVNWNIFKKHYFHKKIVAFFLQLLYNT